MNKTRSPWLSAALLSAAVLTAELMAASPAAAAPGDQPVPPLPVAAPVATQNKSRTASLPAKGLFVGDQLSDATKAKLVELIIESIGLQVEVALLVPTGPWNIDGAGHTDRDLNEARLGALRKFLVDRGVEPKRIVVESRIDNKLKEPRLDVQMIGQPAND